MGKPLSIMTINELIQKISESVLSEVAKQKIIGIAGGYTEVTSELEEQVKDLIQEDIDNDLAALGADDDTPEIQSIQRQLDADLGTVGEGLDSELSVIEDEMAELDAMRAEIQAAEEAHKIAQLRNDLTAGS